MICKKKWRLDHWIWTFRCWKNTASKYGDFVIVWQHKQNPLLQNNVNRVQLYSGYFLNEKCDRIVVILEFIFAVAQVILQCDMQQFGAKVCELHKKFIIEFWELSSWCISEKYQKKYVLKRILTIFTSFWFMTLFMSAVASEVFALVFSKCTSVELIRVSDPLSYLG